MAESIAKKFRSHRHCCVPFCTNDGRYDFEGRLSFHSFPSDKKLRKLWIRKIRRDEGIHFTITRSTFVCSAHFTSGDFKRSLTGLKRDLIPGVVPSVFHFPDEKLAMKLRSFSKKKMRLAEVPTDEDAEADDVESIEKGVVTPWCYLDHDYSVPPTSASVNAGAGVVESIEKRVTVVMPWCSIDHDYSVLPKSCEEQLEVARSSTNFEQLTEEDHSQAVQQPSVTEAEKVSSCKVTQYSNVCSRHFLPEDFRPSVSGKRLLKPDAIPSLFLQNSCKHSSGREPTRENPMLCVRGGGQKTKRKSSRACGTEKVTPENSKKKCTAAGGKKAITGAKTRTPAARDAAINSLARIRKTATSGQNKTTPSKEMNRKRKTKDQFKDVGSSTRNRCPPKISAVEENATGEVFSVKEEPFDPEYYLNAGELPSSTEAISDIKPVFLRKAEPECAHSQQYGKNIKEEFEIELNPDWCPDDDNDERTMPRGDMISLGLEEDTEPLGGECLESRDAGKGACTLVTAGNPEWASGLPTTEGLEQNTAEGSKCAALPQSKPDGLKTAVASDKENGGTDVELLTLSKDDQTESFDPEQSSNGGEQQTVTGCAVVAAVDAAADGSGRGGTAAGIAGASNEETFPTETPLARHEVPKMLLATTAVRAQAGIAQSSKPTSNGRTGQTLLLLTSNDAQQSFTGHSPRNASSQSIIFLTSPSSDCSSQKLLFVPSTGAQNSVAPGHTIMLLNPSSREQIPSEQVPGDRGDQKTDIFLCRNCGNKIVGQDMLKQHLLRCPMRGSLGLLLPPGASQTSSAIVCQTDKRPILPKEVVVVVSRKAPVLQAYGVWRQHRKKALVSVTKDEGSTVEASETNLEAERPFKCDHCYSRHRKLSHLHIHVVRAHGKPDPLLCPVCGRQFQKQSTFNIHMSTHSSDTPFACPQCPKAYKYAATLKSHLRRHAGERPYQCPICSRRFLEAQHMKRHRLTHTRDGPLKCPECPATFLMPSTFKIHLRVHTGERPFPCHFCDKAFRDRSALNVHLRIHTREKPYQCQVCGATFQRSGSLKQHTLGHVGMSPYECQRCGVTCGSRGALKRHMRYHSRTAAADAEDDGGGAQAPEADSKPPSRSQHGKRRWESEREEGSVKRRGESGVMCVVTDDTLITSSLATK